MLCFGFPGGKPCSGRSRPRSGASSVHRRRTSVHIPGVLVHTGRGACPQSRRRLSTERTFGTGPWRAKGRGAAARAGPWAAARPAESPARGPSHLAVSGDRPRVVTSRGQSRPPWGRHISRSAATALGPSHLAARYRCHACYPVATRRFSATYSRIASYAHVGHRLATGY